MKSYYGEPTRSHKRSFERYQTLTPLRPPLPQDWGFATPPKTAIAIISGTGKATDFKFGCHIHKVHPNKSPLKLLQKRERECIQGLPNFLKDPQLFQECVKLRTSNFVCTFTGSIEKKPTKNFGKSSYGHTHGLCKIFRTPIGRIAWSSLR